MKPKLKLNLNLNLKLRWKMLISFLIVLTVMLVVMAIGIFNIMENITIAEKIEKDIYPKADNYTKLEVEFLEMQRIFNYVAAIGKSDLTIDALAKAKQHFYMGDNTYVRMLDEMKEDDERRYEIETLRKYMKEFYEQGLDMAETFINKGRAAGMPLIEEFNGWSTNVNRPNAVYVDELSLEMKEKLKTILDKILLTRNIFTAGSAAAAILTILVALFITGRILSPVKQVTKNLKNISEGRGNLTVRLEDASKDEIGELSTNFNKFVEQLANLVKDVKDISLQLVKSMEDGNVTITSFSENAQNQAAASEQITATVEEVSAGVDQISKGAKDQFNILSAFIDKLNGLFSIIDDMGVKIQETLDMSADIARNTSAGERSLKEMNTSMDNIIQSSEEIKNVVNIINDISEKINLLSLNAAIEAARAGEAGRGFAVVADEISKLAEGTATSIQEISNLIKFNNEEIKNGMANINSTSDTLQEIIDGFNRINSNMEVIYDYSQKELQANNILGEDATMVRNRSDEIKTSTEEQKIAIEEIVKSMSGINDLIQANSSGASELASNTADVTSVSLMLKNKVEMFQV